jgi:DNA primase
MQDTSKYLIHADIAADGVVERSDVVGAVFGQTEGLLGDELDLRELQETSKIGRIDVEIESHQGQSVGEITIATSLDRAETATLAAALETITRVGPCRATVEVTNLEDQQAAKRRQIVDRAHELLAEAFDESMMSSEELVDEVRERLRVENITEYEGLPAGPRVADSDAIVVVEGRSDVLALLKAGIKNAIAVEGTDVPEAVANLTQNRRVTAFLDGDRGGDLIFKELTQVGDLDYVAFAPEGRSVEDLSRHEILAALRGKVEHSAVAERTTPHEVAASDTARTSGGTVLEEESRASESRPDQPGDDVSVDDDPPRSPSAPGQGEETAQSEVETAGMETASPPTTADESDSSVGSPENLPPDGDTRTPSRSSDAELSPDTESESDRATSLAEHVQVVRGTDSVRLLDAEGGLLSEHDVRDVIDVLEEVSGVSIMVLDASLEQQLLDVAADHDLDRIVATELGSFTKRPTNVRIHEAATILEGS